MTAARTPFRLLDDGAAATDAGGGAAEWNPADRTLLQELLEDAHTSLQRDLILRAVDAGHDARTVHGFADTIRAMEDHALYAACCSAPAKQTTGAKLEVLLRAQMDPVFALALRRPPAPAPASRSTPATPLAPPARPVAKRELGSSSDVPAVSTRRKGDGGFAEELFSAAAEFAQVRYHEHVIDEARFTLGEAIARAGQALARGLVVPVVLGARPGDFRRYALLLQLHVSGRTRAFQLHDPFAQELVWVNEADLIAGKELPLSDKVFRRLTLIALPALTPGGLGAMDSGFDGSGERG